jgi:enoyl-[acyl-carrier protein] reductase I
MQDGSSILTMTYYGSEKVVASYNVMGVAKAALEACVRYLAVDLGPSGIRVNAVSAGPVRTLSASAVSNFKKMHGRFVEVSPLRRSLGPDDIGQAALYLCSDMSRAVTGEVLYVDGGYNIIGVPDIDH